MKKQFLLIAVLINTVAFSQTKNINVDFNTNTGTGRKMTGVNTGPHSVISGTTEQCLQSIGTELVRTHDYHGECDYWNYTDFFNYYNQTFNYSFQSHLPFGYNWLNTDTQITEIVNANLQPFFRLGISFPGGGISPASPMPKDEDGINFHTFAGIAKRTAMHYTNGWDSGYFDTIPYWEIWNEPNNNASWTIDSVGAYYRLYKQCADSMKSFNPLLKVGGPAAAKNAFFNGGIHYTINPEYVSDFLNFCKTDTVPLDFYSFHMYDRPNPYSTRILTDTLAYYLNQYGFTNTELIISETNINTGGYVNTSKGCSYLASALISVVNSKLSKFIWYRGVDLSPLCNSDIGTTPSLTLNGYAYRFFNELNDSTPVFLASGINEFTNSNIVDSLNNLMILSGKDSNNNIVKVLISNHESVYSDIHVTIRNLPWTSPGQILITTEKVTPSGYQNSTTSVLCNDTININLSSVTDASVFLITLKKVPSNSIGTLLTEANQIIYPNPASGIVTISPFEKINDELTINIYNIFGSLVNTTILKQNQQQINIEELNNGIYMIEIISNKGSEKSKLIIQK